MGRVDTGDGAPIWVREGSGRERLLVFGPGEVSLESMAALDPPSSRNRDEIAERDVRWLPVTDAPSFRDFMAFEEHIQNAMKGADKDVPPSWYEQPAFYFSNTASLLGHKAPVVRPKGCRALDYELEVACVIGTAASDLDPQDPRTIEVIAGFTLLNDWSARDLQMKEMAANLGPAKGKDFATSIGPWIVSRDELSTGGVSPVPDAQLRALVNGETWTDSRLGAMHFSWPEILAHASANTVLRPGDIIGSGTCGRGCILELRALGNRERHWLRDGDRVELTSPRFGSLKSHIVSSALDPGEP